MRNEQPGDEDEVNAVHLAHCLDATTVGDFRYAAAFQRL